jgi:hypothetical protein
MPFVYVFECYYRPYHNNQCYEALKKQREVMPAMNHCVSLGFVAVIDQSCSQAGSACIHSAYAVS